MKIKKLVISHWPLIIIILLAAGLRLYKLGTVPPHLTPDEASIGYNAYSILKTGRDEYGQLFPMVFKSFGDYKPGLYIYSTVPSVAILGLNEFSVRLPNAIAGVIAVLLIYLVVKKLFHQSLFTNHYSLAAALLLAISPWHIHFSRGAWEVNLALTLTLAGIYFFFRSLKQQKYLLLSALFFASTLITYQGAKLSTTIVIAILGILWRKEFFKFKKQVIFKSALVGLIISIPILVSIVTGHAGRLSVFSVFSYSRPTEYLQKFLDQGSEHVGDISYFLFHSESFNFLRGVMGRYFNHFSGNFLFFEGDWQNPRHSVPYHGVLLLSDLILLLAGIAVLARNYLKREYLFTLLWLLLASLPSALSRDQVHAVRSLNMVIPTTILLALGLVSILQFIKSMKVKAMRILGYLVLGICYLVAFIYYLDAYFVHLPKQDSLFWDYGYKQIVEEITPIQNRFTQIKVQQSYAQPYIYFLFFQKYDPRKYQKQATLRASDIGDVGQVEQLDNICFCPIDWSINRGDKGTLMVADTIRIPIEDSKDEEQFNIIKEIRYLNGSDIAFRIIGIKP